MKIAFDLDKTYFAHPKLFDDIAFKFQSAEHQVGILTGRHEKEGAEVGFQPDFVIFMDCGDLSYIDRAYLKADRMRRERIDILFDDRANLFPREVVVLKIV